MECLNCFIDLEYDSNGVVVCPKCGEIYKCDIRELLDKAGIQVDCKGCMGGNRRQNFNVYHCQRTDYILRVIDRTVELPWDREPSYREDELRRRSAFARIYRIEVYKKDQFKDWYKTLHRPPERLFWPEPYMVIDS